MTWQEVGDRVFCRNYESIDLNIGLVMGAEAVLVIDTRCDGIQARELKEHIAELTQLPVGWVVNTHYHWDHTFGNMEFRELPIWGHRRTAQELSEHPEVHRQHLIELAPEHADRFKAVEIVPPNEIFDHTAAIDLGGRSVQLLHPGRGHTDSDVVLSVDEVLFAGDLVENGAPPAFGDGFPLDWPAAASVIGRLAAGAVVPGHGPVADAAFAAEQQLELAEGARLAVARHEAGMTADQAADAGGPYPHATMVEAMQRAYLQLEGPAK